MNKFLSIYLRKPFYTLIFLSSITILSSKTSAQNIRIGVYDNPPKISRNHSGKAEGIFVDIIEEIARQEGWAISYHFGTWNECLNWLETDGIDIMPDVAYTEERKNRYLFNQLTVLSSWLQIYHLPHNNIQKISDLSEKRIAVLSGSIQESVINNLIKDVARLKSVIVIPLPTYDSTISIVENGNADAVLLGRFYDFSSTRSSTLIISPIILNPSTLHFVTFNKKNRKYMSTIDAHIASMRSDIHSPYYKSIDKWLKQKQELIIPQKIKIILILICVAFIFVAIFALILKNEVKRKTAELRLQNDKLSNALSQLEIAKEEAVNQERLCSMGRLASGLAHDFNNLLSPIIGYTDLIIFDMDKCKCKDYDAQMQKLNLVKNAATNASCIVARMRSFSIASKQSEPNVPLNVNIILQEISELTKYRDKLHSVKVIFDFAQKITLINIKYSSIQEVFMNLFINAIDAMPNGGELTIKTVDNTQDIQILISDTGIGMDNTTITKCLEPFYSTKGENGTGMGLAMVNSIITENNGTLEIKSMPGKGTSFIITLNLSNNDS